LTEVENAAERKELNLKKIRQEVDKDLGEFFQPAINKNYHTHRVQEDQSAHDRLYSARREKLETHDKARNSKDSKIFTSRTKQLYQHAARLRKKRETMFKETRRKELEKMNKSKMSQKSKTFAKRKQREIFQNALQKYCGIKQIGNAQLLDSSAVMQIFCYIGFYRKGLSSGNCKLTLTNEELQIHDKLLTELDEENIGSITVERIQQFIDSFFTKPEKRADYRLLIDTQLHSPPPLRPQKEIYDNPNLTRQKSKAKKLSEILERVDTLTGERLIGEKILEQKRENIREYELTECTFSPKINKFSKDINFRHSAAERLHKDYLLRIERKKQLEAQRQYEEDEEERMQYEEVCAHGRPLGYLDRSIFESVQMPVGFKKAVKRMQAKEMNKTREKHQSIIQKKEIDEKYKKNLRRLKKAQKRMENVQKTKPLLLIEIALSPKRTETIEFFKGDQAKSVPSLRCASECSEMV